MNKNWIEIPNDPTKNVECRGCGAITHSDFEAKLDFHTSFSEHISQVKKVLEEGNE
jgi:hypothetical protein